MYVTDTPVMDRITDPLRRAVEDAQELLDELDMAIYDPDSANYSPRQVCDALVVTVGEIESATL